MTTRVIFFALAVVAFSISGCDWSSPTKTSVTKLNTIQLLNALPNFKDLEIQSCDCSRRSETKSSGVPAPSDTLIELCGSAVISIAGAEKLKRDFKWNPIASTDIPPGLSSVLPANKQFLVSEDFNMKFERIPTFRHGMVLVGRDSDFTHIYFVAQDEDHPLK